MTHTVFRATQKQQWVLNMAEHVGRGAADLQHIGDECNDSPSFPGLSEPAFRLGLFFVLAFLRAQCCGIAGCCACQSASFCYCVCACVGV
jgi:hypothetical protein